MPVTTRPTPAFTEGLLLALVASIGGSLAHVALAWWLPGTLALTSTIAALSLAYTGYLLLRSGRRAGILLTATSWLLATSILCVAGLPISATVSAHALFSALVRAASYRPTPLGAIVQLALVGLGLLLGFGAWLHTGSLLLGLWCFFLVQALFNSLPQRAAPAPAAPGSSVTFVQAQRRARAALRDIAANP